MVQEHHRNVGPKAGANDDNQSGTTGEKRPQDIRGLSEPEKAAILDHLWEAVSYQGIEM